MQNSGGKISINIPPNPLYIFKPGYYKMDSSFRRAMDMKRDKRFVVIEKEGSQLSEKGQVMVIVDRKTGVSYLWMKSGYGAGITPLIGSDGKPVIFKPWEM